MGFPICHRGGRGFAAYASVGRMDHLAADLVCHARISLRGLADGADVSGTICHRGRRGFAAYASVGRMDHLAADLVCHARFCLREALRIARRCLMLPLVAWITLPPTLCATPGSVCEGLADGADVSGAGAAATADPVGACVAPFAGVVAPVFGGSVFAGS